MTARFTFGILVLAFFATTSVIAHGQVLANKRIDTNRVVKSGNLTYDTSKTAIIEFNKKSRWPFDSTFKAATLTQDELQAIDSLLLVCVTDYNTKLDKDNKQWSIDLNKLDYRKQLIVVINKYGQKEVWVNCFCQVDDDKWKIRTLLVEDGGNCYFNFKINLASKKYYELGVNGLA